MARRIEQWERLLRDLRTEFLLREEELELLHRIDLRLLQDDISIEDTLPYIADRTKSLVAADHVSILLRSGSFLEVTYSSDNLGIGQRFSISGSIVGRCLSERRSIFISDLADSTYKEKHVSTKGCEGSPIKGLLAVPIDFKEEGIGVLCAESARTSVFRDVFIRVLETIASQIAIALQRMQHFRSAALFADLDRMLTDPSDTHQVIQRALQRVIDELHKLHRVRFSGAQIMFLNGEHELEIVHSTNSTDRGLSLLVDDSICGRAVREGQTVIIGDVSKDPQYRRMLGSGIQSEMAVPIMIGDDQVLIGVLNIESAEPNAFSGFNQIVLESFADKVKTLLAFAKLRADLTDTLESRHASELLIAIGDQTSNFIHRLNNSVGALRIKILRLQEILADGGSISDNARLTERSLDEMLELADRTLEMPKYLTEFLSKEQGQAVDVNRAIITCLRDINPPASIVVETDLQADLPELAVYSFDLVLQNLIRNAIDAMPSGGCLHIATKLISHPELPSGYVQLAVSDTGIGIPDEVLSRIFELNFTTKRSKGKGLGLGLWWVRAFVLRSRGEISVTSTRDKGATFTVQIPVATRVASDDPSGNGR